MHVLLILPPFDTSSSYGSGKRVQRGNIPALGVGYLAGVLEQRGRAVSLIDAGALGLDVPETVDRIAAEAPGVIGISCLTRVERSAYELARAVKKRLPETPVVMGGPHVTAFAEQVLEECGQIDILVPGEGEYVFAELVDRLDSGESYEDLHGLIYRDSSGEVQTTPVAELVKDLDTIPHPVREIYQQDLYIPLPNQCRRTPATTLITSRGCPWAKCRFCYQGGRYGPYYRRRSPENVVDEVSHLVKDLGIRQISFWDDNFCVMPSWIDRFCRLLDEERLDFVWTVQGRVDTVRKEMLERMAASGCYNIHFGFESGSERMLELINKGITLDQGRRAVKWAKKAGLEVRGSFIIGLPTETPQTAEDTIRFACELNVDWMFFLPYLVLRGTPLEELALEDGHFTDGDIDMHRPAYVPAAFGSAENLAATISSAYRRYYLRPRYVARALWQARRFSVMKNYIDAAGMWLHLMKGIRTQTS